MLPSDHQVTNVDVYGYSPEGTDMERVDSLNADPEQAVCINTGTSL